MKPNHTAMNQPMMYTCNGTEVGAIAALQMRDFVKKSYDEGITNLKIIKKVAGVKQNFADHAAVLLGNDDNYQRVIQRERKKS